MGLAGHQLNAKARRDAKTFEAFFGRERWRRINCGLDLRPGRSGANAPKNHGQDAWKGERQNPARPWPCQTENPGWELIVANGFRAHSWLQRRSNSTRAYASDAIQQRLPVKPSLPPSAWLFIGLPGTRNGSGRRLARSKVKKRRATV